MNEEKETYHIHPIGTVHASEGEYYLEVLEPYRPGLKHLDQFSYVHVFWWAHKHDNEADRAITQTELPYAEGVTAGVFATRAEFRPNPIAVTICFVLDIDEEKGIVWLAWIDAFDGTPVVDLKPYIPVSDRVRDVGVAEWFKGWPEWMEDGSKFFAETDIFGE